MVYNLEEHPAGLELRVVHTTHFWSRAGLSRLLGSLSAELSEYVFSSSFLFMIILIVRARGDGIVAHPICHLYVVALLAASIKFSFFLFKRRSRCRPYPLCISGDKSDSLQYPLIFVCNSAWALQTTFTQNRLSVHCRRCPKQTHDEGIMLGQPRAPPFFLPPIFLGPLPKS